ncbi:hypothetical protein J4233_03185 [Candidatus Pacearchaeota archaeon]|nr:hypothetical protein [Candidatus Pacearchaeota archaeon]
MPDNKKIEKSIASLEKQINKHKAKISAGASKEITLDYWEKEIENFEKEIEKKKTKLGVS